MDKSANFAITGVFAMAIGLFCLELFGIAKDNIAGNIFILVILVISLASFIFSAFHYFTPVNLQFSIDNDKLVIESFRFNKLIKTYPVSKWEICILNIAGKYNTRLALAIKITSGGESFCITEDIDGTKIYGYPIVSRDYHEKYSCKDPGTVIKVVHELESLKGLEFINNNC